MLQDKIDEFKEDYALLIEAGFVATKQLDEMSSTRLFCAAQLLDAKSAAPQLGLGYIALSKLELKKAIEFFEAVLAIEPDNHLAQSFLGISFALSKKHKKGEELIKHALEQSDDPAIKSLGASLLEWIQKDLAKKDKAPFFGESKEEKES